MGFKPYKKLLLVVLDGFGIATATHGNAVTLASPTHVNDLIDHFPATTLQASGPSVGLPWGEMGNSEVGHLNMGAGRIIGQDLSRITTSIEDRSFFGNQAFLAAVRHAKDNGSALHLAGMVSPGGVHSYDEHLYALLGLAAEQDLHKVYVHMFFDGRDTPPQIALDTIKKVNDRIAQLGVGEVVSVAGRFYAMDRAEHWNLTEQTYRAMVFGEGPSAVSAQAAVEDNYSRQIFDEMIPPTVIAPDGGQPVKIADDDALIFFNFRSDRAQQLARAFATKSFSKFAKPPKAFKNLMVVTMTEYARDLNAQIAFPPVEITNGLAEVISSQGLRQFHLAESEKYAHVSVFFNGGNINPFPGEDREIVTSPASNYQNYADIPEMSARKVTESLLGKLKGNYSFFLVNFANPDMVGHTGDLNASIEAVRVVDECLGRISKACLEDDICMIITADHGNVEELLDIRSGGIDKEHSTNPIPLILIGEQFRLEKQRQGGVLALAQTMPVGVLSDIAPTVLELMGLPKPKEMTGISLLPQLLSAGQSN